MDTDTNKGNKKLDDVLIDISRDLWPFLAHSIIGLAVIYFAVKPESFIITAMGIFNLPPQVLMTFYCISMPILLSAMLSHFFCTLWKVVLRYPIAFFLVILFMPFYLLDRFIFKKNWTEKAFSYFDHKFSKNKLQNRRKFLLSNIILFSIFLIFFFSCYLGNNLVSNLWHPHRNHHMVIISYSHYYCQITGTYNETECKFWKNKLKEYRTINSISTPIDYPENYPKM